LRTIFPGLLVRNGFYFIWTSSKSEDIYLFIESDEKNSLGGRSAFNCSDCSEKGSEESRAKPSKKRQEEYSAK
jgi:hypothetical protein